MRDKDIALLRKKLEKIKEKGWVKNQRPGNDGGVGNTLEDLLGVSENNLKQPDFGDLELKSQRARTSSLLTLFHLEPEPRDSKIVPQILLLKYGWPHQKAGGQYPENERSFRQTITSSYSDRGFKVCIDHDKKIIFVDFNYSVVDSRHAEWKKDVKKSAGTGKISPVPFWRFDEIEKKLSTKLKNLVYFKADSKKENGDEFFRYHQIEVYINPSIEKFLDLMEKGEIYVDFDARTGHNHGTKFRIRSSSRRNLYEAEIVV